MLRGSSFTAGGRLGSFSLGVGRLPSFSNAKMMDVGDTQAKDQSVSHPKNVLPFGLPTSKSRKKKQQKKRDQEQENALVQEREQWLHAQELSHQQRKQLAQQQVADEKPLEEQMGEIQQLLCEELPSSNTIEPSKALNLNRSTPEPNNISDHGASTAAVEADDSNQQPAQDAEKAAEQGSSTGTELVGNVTLRQAVLQRLGAAAHLCDAAITMASTSSCHQQVRELLQQRMTDFSKQQKQQFTV